MVKIIRSGRVATFNPNKHPRGTHGRFTETPDIVKATTGRRSSNRGQQVDPRVQAKDLKFTRKSRKPLTQTEILKQSRVLRSTKDAARIYQARLEFLQGLNLEQRRRLHEVLQARKEAKGLQRS
ncbi:hypothetical protein [Nostoc sp. LPT]|uniref:hypothetical protein n=1 Tax=Nostoc sp. LPT TaxID=2815387 RepID=UPI001D6969F7|nr:hypothetical protein [Nostoc sp. LPT]MBN4004800.1 hypothetical protein [Nostoc sp. LPT]